MGVASSTPPELPPPSDPEEHVPPVIHTASALNADVYRVAGRIGSVYRPELKIPRKPDGPPEVLRFALLLGQRRFVPEQRRKMPRNVCAEDFQVVYPRTPPGVYIVLNDVETSYVNLKDNGCTIGKLQLLCGTGALLRTLCNPDAPCDVVATFVEGGLACPTPSALTLDSSHASLIVALYVRRMQSGMCPVQPGSAVSAASAAAGAATDVAAADAAVEVPAVYLCHLVIERLWRQVEWRQVYPEPTDPDAAT